MKGQAIRLTVIISVGLLAFIVIRVVQVRKQAAEDREHAAGNPYLAIARDVADLAQQQMNRGCLTVLSTAPPQVRFADGDPCGLAAEWETWEKSQQTELLYSLQCWFYLHHRPDLHPGVLDEEDERSYEEPSGIEVDFSPAATWLPDNQRLRHQDYGAAAAWLEARYEGGHP